MRERLQSGSPRLLSRLFSNQHFQLCLFVVSLITLTCLTAPVHASINKNRFIVKYRSDELLPQSDVLKVTHEGHKSLRNRAALLNVQWQPVQRLSNGAEVIQFSDSEETATLIKELQQHPDIEYIEPDHVLTAKLIPTDTFFNEQWHYFEPTGGINLPDAWDITLGDSSIVVAVVDTGIVQVENQEGEKSIHPDLAGKILPGFDFISDATRANDGDGRDADASDPGDFLVVDECAPGIPSTPISSSWHGTHVAGTVAANTNDDFGVAGVAGNVQILPVRVLGKCGGLISEIAEGVRWAAGLPVNGVPINPNPARVINMSLGGFSDCSRTMQEAIREARAAGATVVVAAGNEAVDALNSEPANCVGVINVAANGRDGGRAPYSNFGVIVDVAAPGGVLPINGILSTYNQGNTLPDIDGHNFQALQGTSMAAPHVAGVVALMLSLKPDLTSGQVEAMLKTSARDFPQAANRPCNKNQCGEGIVDATATLRAIQAGQIPNEEPNKRFEDTSDTPIPADGQFVAVSDLEVDREGPSQLMRVEIDIKHINSADLKVTIFAPNGSFLVVKNFGGEASKDFSERFVMNAGTIPSEGAWSLMVQDRKVRPDGSAGIIDRWGFEFLD